jgi:hypothetical protein
MSPILEIQLRFKLLLKTVVTFMDSSYKVPLGNLEEEQNKVTSWI